MSLLKNFLDMWCCFMRIISYLHFIYVAFFPEKFYWIRFFVSLMIIRHENLIIYNKFTCKGWNESEREKREFCNVLVKVWQSFFQLVCSLTSIVIYTFAHVLQYKGTLYTVFLAERIHNRFDWPISETHLANLKLLRM